MHRVNETPQNNRKDKHSGEFKQFHKDKQPASLEKKQEFKLQSCEKAKQHFPQTHHRPTMKSHESESESLLTFGTFQSFQYKRPTERLVNLLISICTSPILPTAQYQNIKEAINSFGRELQCLFDKYIRIFHSFQLSRQRKQELNKKLILYIDETMKKEFVNVGESPLGKSENSRQLTNRSKESLKNVENVHFSINNSINRTSPSQFTLESKPAGRGPISKIESSFNQVNKLLQKVAQPRFIRKSNLLGTKRSREGSQSVQEIMQRSLEQRRKRDHSDSTSKQTIYNLNRILNE